MSFLLSERSGAGDAAGGEIPGGGAREALPARDLESFDSPRSHSADVSAGQRSRPRPLKFRTRTGEKKSLARMGNFQNHRRARDRNFADFKRVSRGLLHGVRIRMAGGRVAVHKGRCRRLTVEQPESFAAWRTPAGVIREEGVAQIGRRKREEAKEEERDGDGA